MNKRGVEGLPLKYVIIILVAALVIALAVTMTNTLGWGVKYASNLTNQSVVGNITDALR
ncbi:hypothetical protein HY546_03245 [archaeon]|nr:hypothetical protein [archaeon]